MASSLLQAAWLWGSPARDHHAWARASARTGTVVFPVGLSQPGDPPVPLAQAPECKHQPVHQPVQAPAAGAVGVNSTPSRGPLLPMQCAPHVGSQCARAGAPQRVSERKACNALNVSRSQPSRVSVSQSVSCLLSQPQVSARSVSCLSRVSPESVSCLSQCCPPCAGISSSKSPVDCATAATVSC